MAEEIFKLKTLDVENTVIRQSRVGYKNNPTSKIVFSSPDTMDDKIYSGETGIYSGERNVSTEYLVQGSVSGNNIRTETLSIVGSDKVIIPEGITGIKVGDKIRNDSETSFMNIKEVSGGVLTIDGTPFVGAATIRKEIVGNAEFEYARSLSSENKIFFNQDKLEWGVTGGQFEGPISTQESPYIFPSDDYMVAQFQEASTNGSPIITSVKSERFTVISDNINPLSDLGLNAVPFPHETLKVYWGEKDKDIYLKEEGKDYVVNYSQESEYQFPFPPMEERQVAFLKFLEDLDENQATVDEGFQGYVATSRITEVPGANNLITSVTDIVPDTEVIKVSDTELVQNKDYIIDYKSGLITFVENRNNEHIVESISYPSSLLWDGVSVIKGVTSDQVIGSLDPEHNENLVIRAITGLTGISGPVYFEDTEANNLVRDEDYLLEYNSGAVRINDALEEDECVLVSYYVEGQQEENEDLLKSSELRTKKFPITAGSVVLTKAYIDAVGVERTKVLEEGSDYEISVLTGAVRPLSDSLVGENVKSLDISYIPMAVMNVILQPNVNSDNSFVMTIIDDSLEITSPSVLKFKVRNPRVSVPEDNPFKGDNDPTKTSYTNSIIPDSIQNVSIRIRSGFGTPSEGMLLPGVTEQAGLGVDTNVDFNLDNYIYNESIKELQLDESKNDARPDYNDVVVATYSFIGDTLPYVPVEAIFPIIGEGASTFYIEGHDRTDVLKPNSVLRIDNFNPVQIYYIKIKSVLFDGESTKVEIYGTFPSDIRSPSFYLFDSDVVFTQLPDNTIVDRGLKPGSNQIRLTGNLLQITEAIEKDSLFEVHESEIYRVLSVEIVSDTALISIFPGLRSYISGDVLVSTFTVKDEGISVVTPKLDVLTQPLHPAFTISFTPPSNPIELSGAGLITIDSEKIILQEIVSGYINPNPYLFYFKDYTDIYVMSKAIQGTVSNFLGLDYTPFTISVEGMEQYYLSDGTWKPDTIIPFEEGIEESLPYTVSINPDMYKWRLIAAEKGANKFRIEEADVSTMFAEGNLVAFTSKVTGVTYYHIISSAEAVDNESNNSLKDTSIKLKDDLRINFIDPYFFRYDTPVWVNLLDQYTINTDESSLLFSSDVTRTLRSSMFLKFGDTYIYKVDSVNFENGVTTVKLSPDIHESGGTLIGKEYYPGYLKFTDIPVYLNEITPQPSLTFTYTEADAHTGYANISIDDEKIEIFEYIDGSSIVSKTNTFIFSDYNNIYELGIAINDTESSILGHKPYHTNVADYQGIYEIGTFQGFTVVPTYGEIKKLPYYTLVAQSTFKIEYSLPSSYTGTASIMRLSDRMVLKEELTHLTDGVFEQEYSLLYSSYKTIYELLDAINGLTSTITGINSFKAVEFNDEFSPVDFFTRGVYSIPSTVDQVFSTLDQNIPATTIFAGWSLQGPLNLKRLVFEEDYTIDGGSVTFTNPIVKRDRYLFNYLGLDTLAEYETEEINVFCRFFSTLPSGYRVDAYMDYLNVDQYYIQKITERNFLKTVTVPQVGDLLKQKGGGGGSGSDSGSNEGFPNYQAGNANLYYFLRDEQIKKFIYLKLYNWYKQRLRYFAAEAQISLGFKFGNSTHYWTDGSYYSLTDSLVEGDINYTLTTQDVIDQVDNGLTVFFPIGYNGVSPKYYDRFGVEYKDYKDVYCYNVKFVDDNITSGKIRSWKPYWAPKKDGKHSDLDYLILRNRNSELVQGYPVPFYSGTGTEGENFKDELIYDSESNNFSFLKRIEVGDSVRINNKKTYYKVGDIQNRLDPMPGTGSSSGETFQSLVETLVLEDGKYFNERGIKTFNVSKYPNIFPANDNWLYRYTLSTGYLATDNEINKFVNGLKDRFGYTGPDGSTIGSGGVQYVASSEGYYVKRTKYIDVYVLFDIMESTFTDKGYKIDVKRSTTESFPVYNDEGNFGVSVHYKEIIGQTTGRDKIKKPLTILDVLTILFPIPFASFPESDEFFETTAGTFDEDTGEYILGSYDYTNGSFTEDDDDSKKTINLKHLNFFDERSVGANLDAIKNNLVSVDVSGVSINGGGYAIIDGTTFDGDTSKLNHSGIKLREGDIIPTYLQKGLGKYLDIDFERAYSKEVNDGYFDSIFFRTKGRDIWFQFPYYESDDEVTENFGVPINQTLKGFYDPGNIYTKLVLEKQAWLTEQLIVQDIYDVQLKFARVFSNGVVNAGAEVVSSGAKAINIDYSPFRKYLLSIGDTIKTRMEKYVNTMRFLIRNTQGDLGPIAGILQEDEASGPIIDSYKNAAKAYDSYNTFLSVSFDSANSFYNRIVNNINQWTNSYTRWILSIREGTVFQMQAKNGQVDGNVVVGFNLLDAIKISYETGTSTVILTSPRATVDYDYRNESLRLKLTVEYAQTPDFTGQELDLESGSFEASFLFSTYQTLDSLVNAINAYEYPLGAKFFTGDMVFTHYPEGAYTTLRLSPFSTTDIPYNGLAIEVLNVDDHRMFDSRVLFLNKSSDSILSMDSEAPLNPWPTYISYYNNPIDQNYSDITNYNPKKKAIQGLKVPGSWRQLPTSYFDVLSFSPIQTDYNMSYLVTAVYDTEALDDIVNEQVLNLILPDRTRVSSMISIIDKIDTDGVITPEDLDFIDETETSQRTRDIFIKFLTVKLTQFGTDITVRFNTRRFRTINQLSSAMNGYFYKGTNNEWVPAEEGAVTTDPKYIRLFNSEVIGDPLDQGESSSFEIQIPYEPILRTFKVGPYDETYTIIKPSDIPGEDPILETVNEQYYITKENIQLGWVPKVRTYEEGQSVTLRLNDELEYSPGNIYGFKGLTEEEARIESLKINSDNPNANILPFDMYSWDSNATFEIRNNWFLLRSDNTQVSIPLTGAIGTATYVSTTDTFVIGGSQTYPELKGETVGDLVERINSSSAKDYFYANLKFVREQDANNNVGYFEYTYLPNSFSDIPQASLDTLYLADDPEVLKLTSSRAQNVQYQMYQVPFTTPEEINLITITSDAKIFSISRNTSGYSSITNATYNIDTGSSLLLLTADYTYEMSFSIDLDLSNYATVSELINGNGSYDGINDILAPLLTVPTVGLFSASAISSGTDPTTLQVTSTVSMPGTLKDVSNNNILSISSASIVDSRISLSNATMKVSVGTLTLSATLTYTGSYSDNFSLAQSMQTVSLWVGAKYPLGDDGTYFAPIFNSFIVSTAYSNYTATVLKDSSGAQSLTSMDYAVFSVSESFSVGSTIESLVNNINVKSPLTGVDATYLFTDIPGYRGLRAKFLTPTEGDSYDVLNDIIGSKNIGAIFSAEPGLKLLFMEDGGSYSVTGSGITVINSLGNKTFIQSTNKNLTNWTDSIIGDFTTGLRSIDVLPIKIPGVSYGLLGNIPNTVSNSNEATHVHFGFLGDFKFTQISDYNLYNELSMIKQRLAKPWKDDSGNFENDWYNNLNFYYDFYGRVDDSPDGNVTALHIDKFLGYLKETRFNEIKNGIENEQLINNKYLWLYLKLHKEIGCDQKVRDLLKKIKEDEDDANRLPQDL